MHVEEACPTHARPHQLEWKLTPPVKAGDNTLKQRVCFGLQRGPRLYFRQRGDRRQRQREREQKHAHTLLTPSVKEIQGALEARSGGTLMSRSMNKHKINAGNQDVWSMMEISSEIKQTPVHSPLSTVLKHLGCFWLLCSCFCTFLNHLQAFIVKESPATECISATLKRIIKQAYSPFSSNISWIMLPTLRQTYAFEYTSSLELIRLSKHAVYIYYAFSRKAVTQHINPKHLATTNLLSPVINLFIFK